MKLAIQYVNDVNGKTKAVQLPFSEWEKILALLKQNQQIFKIKSDLKEAFDQVTKMKKSKAKKQTLSDFLNEL